MYSMPVALMTSTMKSEPGRPMIFSPGRPDAAFFASAATASVETVLAAAIVLPRAAALFRNVRRSSPSSLMRFSQSSIDCFVQALVVQRPAHRCEPVAEFAHVRGHAVRVEGLPARPDLDHGEMVRPVGLLHDLVAQVAVVAAARLAEALQQADGVVLARRDDIDVGHDVDAARGARAGQVPDRERS